MQNLVLTPNLTNFITVGLFFFGWMAIAGFAMRKYGEKSNG